MGGIRLLDDWIGSTTSHEKAIYLVWLEARRWNEDFLEWQAAVWSECGHFATYHQSFSHVGGEVGRGTCCGKYHAHYTLLDPETQKVPQGPTMVERTLSTEGRWSCRNGAAVCAKKAPATSLFHQKTEQTSCIMYSWGRRINFRKRNRLEEFIAFFWFLWTFKQVPGKIMGYFDRKSVVDGATCFSFHRGERFISLNYPGRIWRKIKLSISPLAWSQWKEKVDFK